LQAEGIDILRHLLIATREDPKQLGREWEEVYNYALAFADEDAALGVAERLMEVFPNNAKHVFSLAERLSRLGRSEHALEIMRRLEKAAPANPAIDYFLGVYSGQVGELDDANSYFRRALDKKADFGDAWSLLASSGGLSDQDETLLTRLVEAGEGHAMPGTAYALGSLLHGQGRYDDAWAAWEKANQFERARRPFNREGELTAHRAIREADEKIPLSSEASEFPNPLPRSIFVVGLPRSGTSLTEQIIAQQKNVCPLGEAMISRVATWPLGNLSEQSLIGAGVMGPQATELWDKIGGVYRFCAGSRTKGQSHVTDKGALLHLFLGALARGMKEAKFVWVRRDPRDLALSAWRAYFGDGKRWRNELSDMAAYIAAHDELMTYWKSRFPKRIHEVQYEKLVNDPQTETNRLMDFLALPRLDMASTDFSSASVGTASFAQIRSKISPASVGGWKNYEKFIGPASDL
tara:strand:- start:11547 stop:12938 length:1392 start_codon:yes stop_codon:yes gene_type:complete